MALSPTASDRSAFMSMAAKIIPQEVNAHVSAEISVSTVNYAPAVAQRAAEVIMDVTPRMPTVQTTAPAPSPRAAALFE